MAKLKKHSSNKANEQPKFEFSFPWPFCFNISHRLPYKCKEGNRLRPAYGQNDG